MKRKAVRSRVFLQGQKALYRLDRRLGIGGSAETYLATQLDSSGKPTTTKVAIKLPRVSEHWSTAEATRRLQRLYADIQKERPALAKLERVSGIAHVLDTGTFDVAVDGFTVPAPFLVQEYIDGVRLDEHLLSTFGSAGRFSGIPSASDFLFWAKKLVERLLEIHRLGVCHGDLWQNNVMVRTPNKDPEVVLIDFGNSRLLATLGDERSRSDNYYLAPENKVSVLGDIYSAGVTFFYLATGHSRPPMSDNIDALKDLVVRDLQKSNPALYNDNFVISDLIARCLRTAMHTRTKSAAALLREIASLEKKADRIDPSIPRPQDLMAAIRTLSTRQNAFLSGIAKHRLFKLLLEIEDMNSGMFDLTGDHDEIVSGMVELTSLLEQGDEHVVMSLPAFWFPENMGTRGRFLDMNKQAARSGAAIKRIFIIAPSDFDHPDFPNVMRGHFDAIDEVAKLGVNTRDREANSKCFFVGVRLVSEPERKQLLDDAHNSGLIRIGRTEMLTSASYAPDQTLVSVRLRTSAALMESTREFLRKELPKCVPLQDIFEELMKQFKSRQHGSRLKKVKRASAS